MNTAPVATGSMARYAREGHLCASLLAGGLLGGGLLTAAALALSGGIARADYNNSLSTQEQRLYDYGPGGTNGTPKGTSILDSANPLDLMNKIRKGTAMDDATNPTDAIDAALKALEAQAPRPTAPTPGAAVKAP